MKKKEAVEQEESCSIDLLHVSVTLGMSERDEPAVTERCAVNPADGWSSAAVPGRGSTSSCSLESRFLLVHHVRNDSAGAQRSLVLDETPPFILRPLLISLVSRNNNLVIY